MTSDTLLFFSSFPALIFRLFTEIKIPGLNMTPATIMFGILSFYVSVWVVRNVLDIGSTSSSGKSEK